MKAIFPLILAALGVIPSQGVIGGQIPVVNGVYGSVPTTDSETLKVADAGVLTTRATTPGKLRVKENSGVCETTPGVFQASGYGDLTSTESIWFWFFAARKNPDTAPLALWFNGGPGSSSMIGLLQENGPCRITNDSSSVTLNPYSWNNNANVLYIDQPVGVGFSYGDLKVGTSQEAAVDIWKFMQIFLSDSRFAKLAKNNLGIWSESYGGHYAPTFAAYFLSQNAAIASGKLNGIVLNLKALGIGNGLTDPLTQYPELMAYAGDNPYHPLVPTSTIDKANNSWVSSGGCRDQIMSCYNAGSNSVCAKAENFCNDNILWPLSGPYNIYFVPMKSPDPYPADLQPYLNNTSLMSKIGAEVKWGEMSGGVSNNFAATGDWMRNSRPLLENVINAGVRTIIYDGDADYILNYKGVEALVDTLQTKFTPEFHRQAFKPYTVKGQSAGQFKNAGPFSYVRIYGAGHEVPAYKFGSLEYGQAALQMFDQIMAEESLSST
ncbi:serine carboxypeptidase [Pholiota conissans]|uniref:Carboxypeptidase n=1 Tax=Pholiota conissans TaxID=109636 RepID=A0A9P6CRN1_9AGAR|nr:serine carboxypeptidase [Pholiota conissans]